MVERRSFRCGFGDQPGECKCSALSDAEIERLVALYVITEEGPDE